MLFHSLRSCVEPVAWALCAIFAVAVVVAVARTGRPVRARPGLLALARVVLFAELGFAPIAVALILHDESVSGLDALAAASALTLLGAWAMGEAVSRASVRVRAGLAVLGALATLSAGYLALVYSARPAPFG